MNPPCRDVIQAKRKLVAGVPVPGLCGIRTPPPDTPGVAMGSEKTQSPLDGREGIVRVLYQGTTGDLTYPHAPSGAITASSIERFVHRDH